MDKGYVHVYTGDGKGKTTAAFGLVLRAVCAGKNVYVGQFVKSVEYNENRLTELLKVADGSFGCLTIELLGRGCFINNDPEPEDVLMAHEALNRCSDVLRSSDYDVVVLDELCIALFFHLLTVDEVLSVLKDRNLSQEVIITGRKAPQQLIDIADLVTDMREVKHYYQQGVLSRNGIDH